MSAPNLELPDFVPRLPWLGGDLQTLRNTLVKKPASLSPWRQETLTVPLMDGDSLVGRLHHPVEPRSESPLIVLVHGLAGSEDSLYMPDSAAILLESGYRTIRLNLRGAGPSRPLCRNDYHAGKTEDLRAFLAFIQREKPEMTAYGIVVMGFSLGGNLVLKFLGEEGDAPSDLPIKAGISVSAPLDLALCSHTILAPRNAPYHQWLINKMKRAALANPGLSAVEHKQIQNIRNTLEYDDKLVAPKHGWRDAAEYYAVNSARGYLAAIRLPTLLIHARNDPWIPFAAYDGLPWETWPHLVTAFPRDGGHMGFHDRRHGPWHMMAALRFLRDHPLPTTACRARTDDEENVSLSVGSL